MTKKKFLKQDREDALEHLAQLASGVAYVLGTMGDAKAERGDFGESEALNCMSRELYDAVYRLNETTEALEVQS